jgi:hypothetical protein
MAETPLAYVRETNRIVAKLPKLEAQVTGKLRPTRKRLSQWIQGSRNGTGEQRSERIVARATCESVCRSWRVNRNPARRESQRRLWLSVRPESSLRGRRRQLIRLFQLSLLACETIQSECVASPGMNEPFGISRVRRTWRRKSNRPEQHGASRDGRQAKDQLRCSTGESRSCNPDGLEDRQSSWGESRKIDMSA